MTTLIYKEILRLLEQENIDYLNKLETLARAAYDDSKACYDTLKEKKEKTILLNNNELIRLYASIAYLSLNDPEKLSSTAYKKNLLRKDYFKEEKSEIDKFNKIKETYEAAVSKNIQKIIDTTDPNIYTTLNVVYNHLDDFIELSNKCNDEEKEALQQNEKYTTICKIYNFIDKAVDLHSIANLTYFNNFFNGYNANEYNGNKYGFQKDFPSLLTLVESRFMHNGEAPKDKKYIYRIERPKGCDHIAFNDKFRGSQGEAKLADFIARNLPFMKCLTNIRLPIVNASHHSENDSILICTKGVFTIEVKNRNYEKLIIEKSGEVTEKLYNQTAIIGNSRNVVEQCNIHANDIVNLLTANNVLDYQLSFNCVRGICVLTNTSTIIVNESTTPVLKLNTEIINYLKNLPDVLTLDQVDSIERFLIDSSVPAQKYRYRDVLDFAVTPFASTPQTLIDLQGEVLKNKEEEHFHLINHELNDLLNCLRIDIKYVDVPIESNAQDNGEGVSGTQQIRQMEVVAIPDKQQELKKKLEREQREIEENRRKIERAQYKKAMALRRQYFMRWFLLIASIAFGVVMFILHSGIPFANRIAINVFHMNDELKYERIADELVLNPILAEYDIKEQVLLNTKIYPCYKGTCDPSNDYYMFDNKKLDHVSDGFYEFNSKQFIEVRYEYDDSDELNHYKVYDGKYRNGYPKRHDYIYGNVKFDIDAPLPAQLKSCYDGLTTSPKFNIKKTSEKVVPKDATIEEEATILASCFSGNICYTDTGNCDGFSLFDKYGHYDITVDAYSNTAVILLKDGKSTMTITNISYKSGKRGIKFARDGAESIETEMQVYRVL